MSKQNEAVFFDRDVSGSPRSSIRQYYSIAKVAHEEYLRLIHEDCNGLDMLEYGCGHACRAFDLADAGARVVGIDISPASVKQAQQTATDRDLHAVSFRVMDAEDMTLPDRSFDRVFGSGILHHLDITRAVSEIRRILRPGGKAVFLEPLGHNPPLNLFRRLTPSMRTHDEHPLRRADLLFFERSFTRSHIAHYHLCSFLAIPFLPTPVFWSVLRTMDATDRILFRILPPLRYWSWFATIELWA